MTKIDTQPLAQLDYPPANILRVIAASLLSIVILAGGSVFFAIMGMILAWVVFCIAGIIVTLIIIGVTQGKKRRGIIKSFADLNNMEPLEPSEVLPIIPDSLKTRFLRNIVTDAYAINYLGRRLIIFDFMREELRRHSTGISYGIVAVKLASPISSESVKTLIADDGAFEILVKENTILLVKKKNQFL